MHCARSMTSHLKSLRWHTHNQFQGTDKNLSSMKLSWKALMGKLVGVWMATSLTSTILLILAALLLHDPFFTGYAIFATIRTSSGFALVYGIKSFLRWKEQRALEQEESPAQVAVFS